MPKINRVDHVCIAVKDLEQAKETWAPLLGRAEPDDSYVDESEKIKVARYYLGETGFELVESTSPDGDVARFIERHGEGVMLLSFNVDSTRDVIAELAPRGYPFIGGARQFSRLRVRLRAPARNERRPAGVHRRQGRPDENS